MRVGRCCRRSCNPLMRNVMRRRTINGEVIEDGNLPRNRYKTVRFSDEELMKVQVLMEKNGYKSFSSFVRDLLFKKRIVSKREVVNVTDTIIRDKLNEMIYQVGKIGSNYNQHVATFQRIVKSLASSGNVSGGIRVAEEKTERLMHLTEKLRDEVAVMIDIFDKSSKRDIQL